MRGASQSPHLGPFAFLVRYWKVRRPPGVLMLLMTKETARKRVKKKIHGHTTQTMKGGGKKRMPHGCSCKKTMVFSTHYSNLEGEGGM